MQLHTEGFLIAVVFIQLATLFVVLARLRVSRNEDEVEQNELKSPEPMPVLPPPNVIPSKDLKSFTEAINKQFSASRDHLNGEIRSLQERLEGEFTILHNRDSSWLTSSYPRLLQIHIRESRGGSWDDLVKKFVIVRGKISVSFVCESCCDTEKKPNRWQYKLDGAKWQLGSAGGVLAEVGAQVLVSITLKEISAHLVATHFYHAIADPSNGHSLLPGLIKQWGELPEFAQKAFEHLSAQPAIVGLKEGLDALGQPGNLAGHLEDLRGRTKELEFYSFYQNPGDAGHLLIGSLVEEKAKKEGAPLHSGLVRILKKRDPTDSNNWSYLWVCDDCRRKLLPTALMQQNHGVNLQEVLADDDGRGASKQTQTTPFHQD
jgi:hypothetical protein